MLKGILRNVSSVYDRRTLAAAGSPAAGGIPMPNGAPLKRRISDFFRREKVVIDRRYIVPSARTHHLESISSWRLRHLQKALRPDALSCARKSFPTMSDDAVGAGTQVI